MNQELIAVSVFILHFAAIFLVIRLSEKRNANIHLWLLLTLGLGIIVLPIFLFFTSVDDTNNKLRCRKKYNYIFRYSFLGALIGLSLGSLGFSQVLSGDKSTFLFYLPLLLFNFVISTPWSLAIIFIDGSNVINASIFALGSMVNGTMIGAAYGSFKT
ncbi:hypothetical protein SAMN05660420_01285 [Desulfuromusa kysingii]|uniref:Uncharacterized protein n=1 Tax=Desulfuromusa kysingii TaxID=37625 RepID=A0A1H3YL81_9BACT|nr:hypothetical protein [Desulfuromusa kysingii]SEA12243.1 hypothetical protein SAMN05660420_01285 [Desulfuromusa kysingii]